MNRPNFSNPRGFRTKSEISLDALVSGRKDAAVDWLTKAGHGFLLKADENAEPGTIIGYGSKFGQIDSYGEAVKRGAFKESLREWKAAKKPIPMLWQHHPGVPVGGWHSFKEDETGLLLEGKLLLQIPAAAQAWEVVKADVVTGLSIGYREVEADPWFDENRKEGEPRWLKKLDLMEVSVVTFPALRSAQIDSVKARRNRGEAPSLREFEAWIRENLNVSRADAVEIARDGFKAWAERDAGRRKTQDAPSAIEAAMDAARSFTSSPLPSF